MWCTCLCFFCGESYCCEKTLGKKKKKIKQNIPVFLKAENLVDWEMMLIV